MLVDDAYNFAVHSVPQRYYFMHIRISFIKTIYCYMVWSYIIDSECVKRNRLNNSVIIYSLQVGLKNPTHSELNPKLHGNRL